MLSDRHGTCSIPDIMRHYQELIVNCESEVMLATNYWQDSYASSL